MNSIQATRDGISGAVLGALAGDALGVPVEFKSREERDRDPVTGMRGFETWNQPVGTWLDDGVLLFSTAESLIEAPDDLEAGGINLYAGCAKAAGR